MSALDPMTDRIADDSRELLLLQALREYQAALDESQPPDREAFLAKYQAISDDLSDCLDSLDFLQNVAPQLEDQLVDGGDQKQSSSSKSGVQPQLGDFRIIREIGRGGMGVVYEAEQISMSRRVALKVLPFAAILDQKVLQRFRSEAQIAGQLIHQNIVPVYSVGSERSVHYYAMQFIDGMTLAEFIEQLKTSKNRDERSRVANSHSRRGRQDDPPAKQTQRIDVETPAVAALSTARSNADPAFIRAAARLMAQVAEALDYAHGEGVIHRDVKPSNLMLDGQGKIWIADFGLARVETGPSITITGDFLGTLRYMSPEQALAQRVVVDHRTDIYSLGLTFYEFLTQRPAFDGTDRQELLRKKLPTTYPASSKIALFKRSAPRWSRGRTDGVGGIKRL